MTIESAALAMGRRMAEARMTDTVRGVFEDRTGTPTRDPATKRETYPNRDVYAGKARLKFSGAQADDADDLGQPVAIQEAILKLPVEGTGEIPVGAVFEVLTSTHDPGNVGRRFQVSGIAADTAATERRLRVKTYS